MGYEYSMSRILQVLPVAEYEPEDISPSLAGMSEKRTWIMEDDEE
jgi:hypothetical protein